jgi:surface antigen
MKHLPRPCLGRGRLAVAAAAFALSSVFLVQAGPASAQGCDDGGVFSTSKGNLIGSAVGGAAGGLIGNQFGGGTGKGVMTGLGVVGGALAGGYVGRSMEGCDRAPQAAAAPPSVRHASHRAAAATAPAAAPVRAPANEPRTCRAVLSQAVIDGREQPVEGIVCLDADGIWRAASGPAVERAAEADFVLRVQQRLREQGFYVRNNIDGQWGPATSSAVRNFQRANGMAPTGQIDARTRTALGLDPTPLAAANGGGEPVTAGAAPPMPATAAAGNPGG